MSVYYGTKKINAKPMSRAEYNIFRGWELPANEDGNDPGYLVEYLDGGTPNVEGFAGYVSWSPKEQFDNAYQPLGALSFGHALEALKAGERVARSGWNGKNMWIALSPGAIQLAAERFWSIQNKAYAEQNGPTDVLPCLTMKTATGAILMGWLASQSDMLADDWMVCPVQSVGEPISLSIGQARTATESSTGSASQGTLESSGLTSTEE